MKYSLTLIFILHFQLTQSQQHTQPCDEDPYYSKLDFWVGEWDVYNAAGQQVGYDRVEKVQNGCGITEYWHDVRGGTGQSLFYVDNETHQWHQIWITGSAKEPWGQKHKLLVEELQDGGTRFQGSYSVSGQQVEDRTTLLPLPDGTVKQVIERSMDGGRTWNTGFSAIYKKRSTIEDDIKKLNQIYVDGWLKGDSAAVLSTFSKSAVIIPSGQSAIYGYDNIKDYWFPDDGSRTLITYYESPVDEVKVLHNVVIATGQGKLSFTYEKGDMNISKSNVSNFQTVYQRQPDGQWKVISRSWSEVKE